jgi:TolB-like protein/DNA-binding winged helix-turn-helix (wHTH) protein/Flp pilus assembly protein TadD
VNSRKIRFDGWLLDPESGDLERAGTRIRLQEQPVQVLRALIASAGNVVTREQLIALLWPKGVVDFDAGLNTVIRKLRSALGDTSETPRYIETLPRRGYRFIGTLDPEPVGGSAASTGVSPSHQPTTLAEADLTTTTATMSAREPAVQVGAPVSGGMLSSNSRPRLLALSLIGALAVVALLTGVYALWRSRPEATTSSVRLEALSQAALPASAAHTNAVPFAPPAHSIAVLPFVNLSGDKEQEYFSDGLTEELLNSLAHIDGLQVAAATSSFSFRQHPDLADVARKLNVGRVLEGSVRRSGHTIRITAQLVNAVTGFHVWSKTYDRDLGDVLKLQTEIATEVAGALEVSLLGDLSSKIEPGGTHNPAAFDAYLRASKTYQTANTAQDVETAIATFGEAIRLDPQYALAFADRSIALLYHAWAFAKDASTRQDLDKALADARKAIALAPDLSEGHLALSSYLEDGALDFAQASAELERAVALAPGNALAIGSYGEFAVLTGRPDAGVAAARHAVVLDPLNPESHFRLGQALYFARRYTESVAAFGGVLTLDPHDTDSPGHRGLAFYNLGDLQNARTSCEGAPENEVNQWCLALAYHKLGRQTDAEAALAKLRIGVGDRWAYRCATIYAQWGNTSQALEQLDLALRKRVPELRSLKVDPLMDALRNEPRFQAIERTLNFPS